MKPLSVHSLEELEQKIKTNGKSYLLLFKKGAELSEKALNEFTEASIGVDEINLLAADLTHVRDIHPKYGITTAPVLLEFDKQQFKNVYKGAYGQSFYKALFHDALYIAKAEKSGKPVKRVTVYSTPTCSWCNTLKSYLRTHNIRFTDVDVSRNPAQAQEMVRKSGQQGVPQTDINGEVIVGFDKAKINRLLDIKEHVN